MNKCKLVVISILTLVSILLLILFFSQTQIFKAKESSNKDYNIAVIETTEQDNESCITFYNKDFKSIDTQEIKLGSMGSSFDLPRIYNKNMYVIPKGIGNQKDLRVIMEYNMENGKYKTYDMKQPGMNSFSVNNKSIYTVNTLNNNSIISWYDRITDNVKTISIEKTYIGRIDLYNDTLYAFGVSKEKDGMKSNLYLIDTNSFKITDIIDISKCGVSVNYSLLIGDYIYFTSQTEMLGMNEVGSNILSKFNIKDKTISTIRLKEWFPFQIINYQDKLIISHYDMVQTEGNKITIYDLKTNTEKVITLDNNLAQIFIKNNTLYSMDKDYFYVYSINNTKFNLIRKIDIHTKKKSSKFFYLSSFFFNNEIDEAK